jgi:hypothetical protein
MSRLQGPQQNQRIYSTAEYIRLQSPWYSTWSIQNSNDDLILVIVPVASTWGFSGRLLPSQ